MSPQEALQQAIQEALARAREDFPSLMTEFNQAAEFHEVVKGAVVKRSLSDAELKAILDSGNEVERDSNAWGKIAEVVGQLVPQLLTLL